MGDIVLVDMCMFEVMNFQCDELFLIGEVMFIEKIIIIEIYVEGGEKLVQDEGEVGIGDCINIVYVIIVVQKGCGCGIVICIGMQIEVGKIVVLISKKRCKFGRFMNWKKYGKVVLVKGVFRCIYDFFGKFFGLIEGIFFQIKLVKLVYLLFFCVIVLVMIVFSVNKWFNLFFSEFVIYVIFIGIVIIFEFFVVVLIIFMVVVIIVMRKVNVVVCDLLVFEVFGGVINICFDKMGIFI